MYLESLHEATKFVTAELQRRGYEIRSGVWVNDGLNAMYTTNTEQSFFLKYDKAPYYKAGEEFNFPDNEMVGVCINKMVYDQRIVPAQAEILYALPEAIYHIGQKSFDDYAIPGIQKSNKEYVMAIPFSKFEIWVE